MDGGVGAHPPACRYLQHMLESTEHPVGSINFGHCVLKESQQELPRLLGAAVGVSWCLSQCLVDIFFSR